MRTYDVPDGILGEDHNGDAPSWWTRAWCTDLDKARELADALVAYRLSAIERPARGDCARLRAEVWEHVKRSLANLAPRIQPRGACV
ncbi:hypothetical protein [Streptomyces sp. PSAA01]|uniref:hypothetical protein n=1 Tax=Streptomyces sp. PSAA01 TaxID=2912762 RepID=UPI001F1EE753|nr:hypothetical protein [Streptomyces sp. PSAA01]MCG0283744.1 hypothetical protein [Streptomyces sp. PSAA01]